MIGSGWPAFPRGKSGIVVALPKESAPAARRQSLVAVAIESAAGYSFQFPQHRTLHHGLHQDSRRANA